MFQITVATDPSPSPIEIDLGGSVLPFAQAGTTLNRLQFVSGGVAQEAVGKIIQSFALNSSTVLYAQPPKVDFKDIVGSLGSISITHGYNLNGIKGDSMQYIGGSLSIYNNSTVFRFNGVDQNVVANLGAVSFPNLKYIEGTLAIGISGTWAFINLPYSFAFSSLESVGGINFQRYSVPIDLPALKFVRSGGISVSAVDVGTFSCSSLVGCIGNMTINNNPALATLQLPNLKYVSGNISIANNAGLADVRLDNLIAHGTGSASFAGNALNQTSVDNILAAFARLDGTNGADVGGGFGTGQTLTLTGGTNAAPSAAGLASRAIITGRGATVTHN